MKVRLFFVAIYIALGIFVPSKSIVFAQDFASASSASAASSTTSDELCTMSNGSIIPCQFLEEAEKSIVVGSTGIIETRSGKPACQYKLELVDCGLLRADGSPTLWYFLRPPSSPLWAAVSLLISLIILGGLYYFFRLNKKNEK